MADARSGRALTRPRLLLAGLLLLLSALIAADVLVGQRLAEARAEQAVRENVLQAARQQVVNFTTMDYRSFDQDAQRLLAASAGDLAEQYSAGLPQVKDLVTKNKTVSKGKVLEAGIVTVDPDSARVLVVADAEVSNVASKQPTPRHYRLQLDLVHRDGRWLTTDMQFVA